jgi:hypothetical protein
MLRMLERIREWWRARRPHKLSAEKARERVQRGATYLDNIDPEWYRRVDAETLALGDGRHCILGQLHGEFRLGLGRSQLLTMSSAPRASLSPVAHGFKCVEGVPEPWQDRDYELLNDAWRDAVRRRQEADPTMGETDATTGDSLPDDAVTLAPARESA